MMTAPTNSTEKCYLAFEFAGKQLRHLLETEPDYFPMYTVKGRWRHGVEAWTDQQVFLQAIKSAYLRHV